MNGPKNRYILRSSRGHEVFRGDATDCAEFCGMVRRAFYQAAQSGKTKQYSVRLAEESDAQQYPCKDCWKSRSCEIGCARWSAWFRAYWAELRRQVCGT